MFNYTFKILYILGCKNPKNALIKVMNSTSIPKEVAIVMHKAFAEPQYARLWSKKQNDTIVTGFVWNNGKYEVAAYETIGKSGEPWYEVNANPIPEPKRQLILSTSVNDTIPKDVVIPSISSVKNIKQNILLHAHKIYNQPNENYFSFDKNGNVILYSSGDRKHVSKNILLDKTHIYELHNHPQRKSHAVNTFSDDDVIEFMREPNLKRSYVVGNDKTLFTLIKLTPLKFTKLLETQLRKDFSFKNLDDVAMNIYNKKYSSQYAKKSDTEARYKYEMTIWEAFEKIAKKYGLKFVISKI
ncbi:MAG: hypothetical protein M0R51_10550 [Clostridia bacterium]|jgi:hypothetical protein|nr:hypothetical protein [Clostridia bacterium]